MSPPDGWPVITRDVTPYVHWFEKTEREALGDDFLFVDENGKEIDDLEAFARGEDGSGGGGDVPTPVTAPVPGFAAVPMTRAMFNRHWAGVITEAKKDGHKAPVAWPDKNHWKSQVPELDRNTVLVAVIDAGIALDHRRLRLADGRTRVVSAWQQGAPWAGQPWLPFGRELFADEIDRLLCKHSRPRDLARGRVDAEGFCLDAGLVERARPGGMRELDHRVSHGAHMADLAAGADADAHRAGEAAFAERVRIIAVNLPPQVLHGSAGNFLQFYADRAVRRVAAVADALSKKACKRLPLLVNFSYGMQAGPRDGPLHLERLMRRYEKRAGTTSFSLPAGNGNLDRQVGRAWLKANEEKPLPGWRIMPSDDTSGFLEIWVKSNDDDPIEPKQLQVTIHAPGSPPVTVCLPCLNEGFYAWYDVGPGARLYAARPSRLPMRRASEADIHLVLAVAPTAERPSDLPTAPAGLWRISLLCDRAARADIVVQSDQARHLHHRQSLQSYLDDPLYQRFLPNGELRDSYAYPWRCGGIQEDPCAAVTREGTVNALATSIDAIGGHVEAGGRPALYSPTADREALNVARVPIARIARTYPSEDTAHLFGIRAAGARDGSSAALRGTSTACAMATRAKAMAELRQSPPSPLVYPPAAPAKVGKGEWPRKARPDVPRVARARPGG